MRKKYFLILLGEIEGIETVNPGYLWRVLEDSIRGFLLRGDKLETVIFLFSIFLITEGIGYTIMGKFQKKTNPQVELACWG